MSPLQDAAGAARDATSNLASAAGRAARPISEHAREIRRDAAALAEEVRGTTRDLEHVLSHELTQRPFRTIGAAAAIGYLLGGGLNSKLTVSLLGTATRLTTALVVIRELYEIGERLQSGGSGPASGGNSPG